MTLELKVGPMFAGKTEELVNRVRVEAVADKRIAVFHSSVDNRYSLKYITTHNGARVKAIPLRKASSMLTYLGKNPADIIGIDEIQFFDEGIIDICKEFAQRPDIHVIASGLNLDFKRDPFKFKDSERDIRELMPYADIKTLKAVCTYLLPGGKKCKQPADYTQRVINGVPAPYNSPVVMVGSEDKYKAVCLEHHFVPGKDKLNVHYWKSYLPIGKKR